MSAPVVRRSSVRGRQGEARRNDAAVLAAARDVFAEQGARAPVSAIAARAGVGVGTLYRRYGSKTQLRQQLCLLAMEQARAAAEEALTADEPWSGLAAYVRTCVEFRSGALASLADQIDATPQMWRLYRTGRRLLDEIVARAHRDGSLRADATALDIAWLIEQYSRRAPGSPDPREEDRVRDRLLVIALDGLRTGEHQPLPGRPPSRRRYEGRWQRHR